MTPKHAMSIRQLEDLAREVQCECVDTPIGVTRLLVEIVAFLKELDGGGL